MPQRPTAAKRFKLFLLRDAALVHRMLVVQISGSGFGLQHLNPKALNS